MAFKKNRFNTSYSVLRANPRISGNVKITVDSSQNIWLNSINSVPELSNSLYKGFRISSSSDYAQDLYRFFDKGTTPEEFVFAIKNENNPVETFVSDYADQFEGIYTAGATNLISDVYSERFSYLAPLWMSENIPNYFVIYRIDDPIDYSYRVPVTSLVVGSKYKVDRKVGDTTSPAFSITSGSVVYSEGSAFVATTAEFTVTSGDGEILLLDDSVNIQNISDPGSHLINKILPKSQIVASFDLGSNTEIGKYLRKIKENANYKKGLVDVRFEENSLTKYNGVDYNSGLYTGKGEYLYDFYTQPSSMINFDQFVTDGFKRNGIISYNLLNLEFLFDDNDAPLYSINRYFGFFVDTVPTGSFKLDGDAFFRKSFSSGNYPEPKSNLQIASTTEGKFYQQNPNGVRLFIDESSKWGHIPSSDDVNIDQNKKLFYLKDRNSNIYSYKRTLDYPTSSTKIEWGTNSSNINEAVLSDQSVEITAFTGFKPNATKQIEGVVLQKKGNPYTDIQILGQFQSNECILLYHPLGHYGSGIEKYDIIKASDLSFSVDGWGPGSSYHVDNTYYFHPYGTNKQISQAISSAINSIHYKTFKSFNIEDRVIVRADGYGFELNRSFGVDAFTDLDNNVRISRRALLTVNSTNASDFREKQPFVGGTDYANVRVKILSDDAKKITVGKSCIRTNYGISKINGIFEVVDDIYTGATSDVIKDFSTHSVITFNDHVHTASVGYMGKILIEELFEIETGVLSIYPVKDFDLDFWSSDYNKTPTEEYYKYLDVQPDGVNKIEHNKEYSVVRGSVVKYNGVNYGNTSPFVSYTFTGVTGVDSFSVVSNDGSSKFSVIPRLCVLNPGSSSGRYVPMNDLDRFTGFSGLQDNKYLDDLNSINTKKDEMFFGKLNTEYEYLKENYLRENVTKSRVVPYITKWVLDESSDARGNDYRLNTHVVFTPFNFSPSFFSADRNPKYFTHEWYLLETPPTESPVSLLSDSKNYCHDVLDINQLINTDPGGNDYFNDYFTSDGEDYIPFDASRYSSLVSKPIDEKFTYFRYNEATGYSETIFRGVKVRIKTRTDSSVQTGTRGDFKTSDRSLNGYKFACLIRPVEDSDPYSPTPPITYKVYKNDQHKTVTFVISIINKDSRYIDINEYLEKSSETNFNYYFNHSVTDVDFAPYKRMSKTATTASQQSVYYSSILPGAIETIEEYITDQNDPNAYFIYSGNWMAHFYFLRDYDSDLFELIFEVFKSSSGSETTLLVSSSSAITEWDFTNPVATVRPIIQSSDISLSPTDRIGIRIKVQNTHPSNTQNITYYTEGAYYSYIETPLTSVPAGGPTWDILKKFNPTGVYGGIDYFSLYSFEDQLKIVNFTGSGGGYASAYYGPLYGDQIAYSDVKLSASLNSSFSVSDPLNIVSNFNSGTYYGSGIIPIIPNDDFQTDLRDEISTYFLASTPTDTSGPSPTLNGFFSPKNSPVGSNWYTLPWSVGVSENVIYFNNTDSTSGYYPDFSNLGYPPPGFASAPVGVNLDQFRDKAVYQSQGGKSYWKKMMEKISFSHIQEMCNKENPYVKYYSYAWDSTLSQNVLTNESFALEMIQPSAFLQTSELYTVEDTYKPSTLSNVVAGYQLDARTQNIEFYRYGGGYTPKFRDIIYFENNKNDSLLNDTDSGSPLTIAVKLIEKKVDSKYYESGSDYEIEIDGSVRKELRLVKGLSYIFAYDNFTTNVSPALAIQTDFVLSKIENSALSTDLYTKGFTVYPGGTGALFEVPYDAPSGLYYEIGTDQKGYAGAAITIVDSMKYQNTTFGTSKQNFGLIKNTSFNRRALSNPFNVDPNSGYKPQYPLVNQAPFGIRDVSVFESTWDPGRFTDYSNGKSQGVLTNGAKSMTEVKNFFGSKIMATPQIVRVQTQNVYPSVSSDSTQNDRGLALGIVTRGLENPFLFSVDNYPDFEIFWGETEKEFKAQLLLDRSLIKYFKESGVSSVFNKFLVPEFGLAPSSSFSADIDKYLRTNVLPTYEAKEINIYFKKVIKDPNVTSTLPPIVSNLTDHDKMFNGYYKLDQNQIVQSGPLTYEFTLTKDPKYDYSIAFSYSVGKI